MAITKNDMETILITKDRFEELTKDELAGTVKDTRNDFNSNKSTVIDRTDLNQSWVDIS